MVTRYNKEKHRAINSHYYWNLKTPSTGRREKLSEFNVRTKIWLVYEIKEQGIKPKQGKVKVSSKLKSPTALTELDSIVRANQYIAKFISTLAEQIDMTILEIERRKRLDQRLTGRIQRNKTKDNETINASRQESSSKNSKLNFVVDLKNLVYRTSIDTKIVQIKERLWLIQKEYASGTPSRFSVD